MIFPLKALLGIGVVGIPAMVSSALLRVNLNSLNSANTKIFKISPEQEDNCKPIKLSSSAESQHLKLWVCEDETKKGIPAFYYFDNNGNHSKLIEEPFVANKVEKIELKVSTTSHELGKYDLNVFLFNGNESWTKLYPKTYNNSDLDELEEEEEVENDTFDEKQVFLLKNSLNFLKTDSDSLETKENSSSLDTLICNSQEFSLTDNGNQIFFF